MKKVTSLLLILTISVIFGSCEQARTVVITYDCLLTHYYSRHTADLDKVKTYIYDNGANPVGSSFRIPIYGKSDEACYAEGDRQVEVYFTTSTSTFSDKDLAKQLGDETEFEYSFCRVNANGDTLKIASYQYNMK